jgi:hypothetical protein
LCRCRDFKRLLLLLTPRRLLRNPRLLLLRLLRLRQQL